MWFLTILLIKYDGTGSIALEVFGTFTWVPLVFHITVKYKSHSETIKYFYLLPIDTNKRKQKAIKQKRQIITYFKKET